MILYYVILIFPTVRSCLAKAVAEEPKAGAELEAKPPPEIGMLSYFNRASMLRIVQQTGYCKELYKSN